MAQITDSFSGAEIRQSIIEAMYQAFSERREFTTNDIKKAISDSIPLANIENDQMLKLKKWATSGRIRLASSKDIVLN